MRIDEFNRFFDEEFENAVKSAYRPVPPPNSKKSFDTIKVLLEQEKKRRYWIHQMKLIAVCAFLLFFGAIVFGNVEVSKAFSPFYKAIQQMKDEMVQFFIGTGEEDESGAKTTPPPDFQPRKKNGSNSMEDKDEGGFSTRKQVSLKEAEDVVIFDFYIPKEVPRGFILKSTEVYFESGMEQAHMIDMWYEGSDQNYFSIIQRPTDLDTVLSASIEKSAGTSKEIQVQGYQAILIQYNDGRVNLKSVFDNVLIDLSGTINEEQLLYVAKSLTNK